MTEACLYTGAETRSAGLHFASVIAERRRALEHQRSPQKISSVARESEKREGGKT